jgi:hypothetical protein
LASYLGSIHGYIITRHAETYGAINNRKAVYEAAYAKNPERWSGSMRNWQRIEKVHLNPHKNKEGDAKNIDIQARKVA